jgi:putative salt-induced outer membrane protein YdiY
MILAKKGLLVVSLLLAISRQAAGQAVPVPTPVYTGSVGGGLALTGGNTDTQNFNFTFNLVRDPKTRNVMKANAAYLRGTQNDILNVDRTNVLLRDEYTLSSRVFVFGQVDYLRDEFKHILFLWAPVGGLGFKLANTDRTKFDVSGGAGGFFERNPGRSTSKSGSVNAGQTFQQKISGTSTLNQTWSTIWKTSDFADSLTNFSVGLTTSIASKIELKFEFLDSYKNKPTDATIKKNDTAFVTSFVVKFSQ